MSLTTALLTAGINAISSRDSIINSIKSIGDSYRMFNLHYPLSMTGINQMGDTDKTLELIRPTIIFTCNSRSNLTPARRIAFPIPQGLEFSDGASYDDTSLGFIASGIINTTQTAVQNAKEGNINDVITGGIDSLKKNFSTTMAGAGMALTQFSGLSDSNKTAVGIAMKMTVNRHVTTEFTGVGTRNYGFKFKMIGSSKEESKMIKDICTTFREGLYPDGDNIALNYPPTWTIRFMLKSSDIEYIPKIWECYLTSANISYNSSSGLWHDDGSPLECDISVAFKETRSLTYKDIRDLQSQPFVNILNKNKHSIPTETTKPSNSGKTSDKQGGVTLAKK